MNSKGVVFGYFLLLVLVAVVALWAGDAQTTMEIGCESGLPECVTTFAGIVTP